MTLFSCGICDGYVEETDSNSDMNPYERNYTVRHDCDCKQGSTDHLFNDPGYPYVKCADCGSELFVRDIWEEEYGDEGKELRVIVMPCPKCEEIKGE